MKKKTPSNRNPGKAQNITVIETGENREAEIGRSGERGDYPGTCS